MLIFDKNLPCLNEQLADRAVNLYIEKYISRQAGRFQKIRLNDILQTEFHCLQEGMHYIDVCEVIRAVRRAGFELDKRIPDMFKRQCPGYKHNKSEKAEYQAAKAIETRESNQFLEWEEKFMVWQRQFPKGTRLTAKQFAYEELRIEPTSHEYRLLAIIMREAGYLKHRSNQNIGWIKPYNACTPEQQPRPNEFNLEQPKVATTPWNGWKVEL